MKNQIIHLGLDVDDQAFHFCFINSLTGETTQGSCRPQARALQKALATKVKDLSQIRACYEAGYLGFSLQRELKSLGIACEVVASSLIPTLPGHRVKTDRLDSEKLALYYQKELLTTVSAPTQEEEAVRDLIRTRRFFMQQLADTKRYLLALCRRHHLKYRENSSSKKSHWTKMHRAWLKRKVEEVELPTLKTNLSFILLEVNRLELKIDFYNQEIEKLSETSEYQGYVQALRCFRGINTLTAMGIVSEIREAKRFSHPQKLTSYAGLDVREYSSGGKQNQFSITKMGNSFLRTMVVESAQFVTRRPQLSKDLIKRRQDASPEEVEIADRCMQRLYKKATHLYYRSKPLNKVKVACAREFLSFIWESMRYVENQKSLSFEK